MLLDTLSDIGKRLNDSGIMWAVGASIVLNQFGLIDKPNDIDIFVDIKDVEKVDIILRSIGTKKISQKNSDFSTRYFYEYNIEDVNVDVIAGLIINHNEGSYKYVFDRSTITEKRVINGVEIPLTSLEDWYVLYQIMPEKDGKADIIEKYLRKNGIKNPELLKRAEKCGLPNEVKLNIEKLLAAK